MKDVQIVTLPAKDWKAYKQLRLNALKEEPAAFFTRYSSQVLVPDLEWKERLSKYTEKKGNWMVFARIDKNFVGMMGAYQTKEDFKRKGVHLMAVFVDKKYRGKGISKTLLAVLLKELKKAQVSVVALGVNCTQKAAIRLYKGFGFVLFNKKRVVLGDGKRHTEYFMRLRLT